MEKSYPFRNSIIRVALLIIIFTTSISCGVKNQKYHTHPNAYIINQLAHEKIVMLADFSHGYALPYKSLISLLNKWIDKVKSGECKDYNLSLILEADTQEVSNLKKFLLNGNYGSLLKFWLPYNTMEWLEFCADLREIDMKINKLNEDKNFTHKIHFDLSGGETYNVFDSPKKYQSSKIEGIKFFVNLRDSLASQNIITYLDKNKNRKAIIFYGGSHLIKNYVHKNVGGVLPDSETKGYYLAHYLKERYGENSVLSINQSPFSKQMLGNSLFPSAMDSDIFVYSNDIQLKKIQPQNYDGFIIRHEKLVQSHDLRNIFSVNIIKADIERMRNIKNHLSSDLAGRYYNEAEESLELLTGQKFNQINEWENWIKKNDYDGIARLDSKEFENYIFDNYYGNPTDNKIKLELYKLGFEPTIMGKQLIPKSEWVKVWKDVLPQIKYLNAVGLLWVGTSEEKQEAKRFLLTVVRGFNHGQKFEPQDYLKLYRKYYDRVNY
ncbi:MAG: hypothetical protein ACYDEE_18995 [Ignavibacteriaceae bacterium]